MADQIIPRVYRHCSSEKYGKERIHLELTSSSHRRLASEQVPLFLHPPPKSDRIYQHRPLVYCIPSFETTSPLQTDSSLYCYSEKAHGRRQSQSSIFSRLPAIGIHPEMPYLGTEPSQAVEEHQTKHATAGKKGGRKMAEQSKMDDARVDEQMSGQAATAEGIQACIDRYASCISDSSYQPPKRSLSFRLHLSRARVHHPRSPLRLCRLD